MAERRYGRPPAPTTADVRSVDWCGRDLSGQEHNRVAFRDVDMSETTGTAAVFTECTFTNVRLTNAVHTSAAFVNCTFTRCDLTGARFAASKLVGTLFDRCHLDRIRVEGGDWSFVGLPGCDLRTASFLDVRMREIDLVAARCEGAVMRRVDLSAAWLHGADLSRCDLRGSDLSGLDPRTVKVAGAVVDAAQACVIVAALGLDIRVTAPNP